VCFSTWQQPVIVLLKRSEVIVMPNGETLRYLVAEVAGAALSDAEWQQVETQAETLQAGLEALDSLDLSAAEPAVEFDCAEDDRHGE